MALSISLPLEEKLIPNTIASVAETGGTSFRQFQETLYRSWKRVGAACKFCSGPLDSSRCASTVYPYFGGDQAGPASADDCYIVSNMACRHEFHSGCLHQAVREGAGMSRCPVDGCNAKWFDHITHLSAAYTVNYLIRQHEKGEDSKPLFSVSRSTTLYIYSLTESLVLAAYGLRRRRRSHNTPAVLQHGREILEALIARAKDVFKDGEKLAVGDVTTILNDCAFWILFEDLQKWPHHQELLAFITQVVIHGMQYYTRGF